MSEIGKRADTHGDETTHTREGVAATGDITMTTLAEIVRANHELPSPAACRTLRRSAGISEAAVARAVGVSRQAVHLWEIGERSPRGLNRVRYLQVLRRLRDVMDEPLESWPMSDYRSGLEG